MLSGYLYLHWIDLSGPKSSFPPPNMPATLINPSIFSPLPSDCFNNSGKRSIVPWSLLSTLRGTYLSLYCSIILTAIGLLTFRKQAYTLVFGRESNWWTNSRPIPLDALLTHHTRRDMTPSITKRRTNSDCTSSAHLVLAIKVYAWRGANILSTLI